MATKKTKPPPLGVRAGASTRSLVGSLRGRVADLATPAKKPKSRPAAAIAPTQDDRAEAERLVEHVYELRSDVNANFYRMGIALRDLRKPERYRSLGYKSFHDLLEERKLMTRMQASKLVKVVDAFPEQVARAHGVEKSCEILRLAAHMRITPAQLLRQNPRLTLDDGSATRLDVIKATDLVAVVNALRGTTKKGDKGRAERATRALAQSLAHAGIDPERVRTIKRRSGAYLVRIELPPAEAEELLALLRARK